MRLFSDGSGIAADAHGSAHAKDVASPGSRAVDLPLWSNARYTVRLALHTMNIEYRSARAVQILLRPTCRGALAVSEAAS
ncbi:hypothetical protein, partial [Xanthomonas perforans]